MKLTPISAGGWHPIVWIEQKGGGSKNLFSLFGLVHFFLLSSDIGVLSSSAFRLGWNYFPGFLPCEQQAVGMLSLHNGVSQFLELISLPLSVSLCVCFCFCLSLWLPSPLHECVDVGLVLAGFPMSRIYCMMNWGRMEVVIIEKKKKNCTVNVMLLNMPKSSSHFWFMETLSSMKLITGAKKTGDCCSQFSSVQSLSPVQLLATPWIAACQASVHHQLQEFTQTHGHRVSDAIQPSHPL